MLKNIAIQNFQSHKVTNLEFSPGVNVIVGPSNSGKTAILRALNWLWKNRPLGDNFIHRGENQVSITLSLEENGLQEIEHTRDKSDNSKYKLKVEGKKVQEISGSKPSQEILDLLNFEDINLQDQFDQYFLVFDSPGQVATYIRSATGLEKLDKVVDLLGAKIRQTKTAATEKDGELEVVTSKLKELDKIDLEKLSSCLEAYESVLQKLRNLESRRNQLTDLYQKIVQLERNRIILPVERIQQIKSLTESLAKDYCFLREKYQRLSSLSKSLSEVSKSLKLPNNLQEILSKSSLLRSEYNKKCERLQKLHALVEKILKIEEEGLSFEIDTLKVDIRTLKEQLTTCPNCGSELNEVTKHNLLEGFACGR